MKVNFLGKLPIDYSSYGKLSEFTKSEIEQLKDCGLDEVWYWYSEAPYEGSGQILMRMGELYDLHDAGHCSCYGPINRLKFNGQSLEDLATSVNPEYMFNECKELFELAGYKFYCKYKSPKSYIKS